MILFCKADFETERRYFVPEQVEERTALEEDILNQQRYALELQQRKPGLVCEVVTVVNNRANRRRFTRDRGEERLMKFK